MSDHETPNNNGSTVGYHKNGTEEIVELPAVGTGGEITGKKPRVIGKKAFIFVIIVAVVLATLLIAAACVYITRRNESPKACEGETCGGSSARASGNVMGTAAPPNVPNPQWPSFKPRPQEPTPPPPRTRRPPPSPSRRPSPLATSLETVPSTLPTRRRSKTTTPSPTSPPPARCVDDYLLLEVFKGKCSTLVQHSLTNSKEMCSNLHTVLMCVLSQLPDKAECDVRNVRAWLVRINVSPSLKNAHNRLKHYDEICPAETRGLLPFRPALYTIAPLPMCFASDDEVVAAFYDDECTYILPMARGKSINGKCRVLFQVMACAEKILQKNFPECTWRSVYGLFSHPSNERYFVDNYKFKPSLCTVPEEGELPQPLLPPCNATVTEVIATFRNSCLKAMYAGEQQHAYQCRRFDKAVHCTTEALKISPNTSCSEGAVRKGLSTKEQQSFLEQELKFRPDTCGKIQVPKCNAPGSVLQTAFKEKCLFNIPKKNKTENLTVEHCKSLHEMQECTSLALHNLGYTCLPAAVRWHLQTEGFGPFFQGRYGYKPVECSPDYLPPPPPICPATDENIIDAIYDGCIWPLYGQYGTIESQCSLYEGVVTCAVGKLNKTEHYCNIGGVRWLMEHENNRGYFQSNFDFHPDNCTMLWTTPVPASTTRNYNTPRPPVIARPGASVVPCGPGSAALQYLVQGCTKPLQQEERLRQRGMCGALPDVIKCVREYFLRTALSCTQQQALKAVLLPAPTSYIASHFNFNVNSCVS